MQRYSAEVARPARRAITDKLPSDIAFAAVEFINGPLIENPHRVGKELDKPMAGIRSARLMREWRILYRIDEKQRRVVVLDIRHRRDAYRSH